ncbi:hypothetical protein EI555_012173 [Monodon monoceros]|uniref:Uncharacterized protein n=1 Tax=Monodon monoceros TaxID=40151 RepID=A0A4U1EJJ1_MONMO|nr:hypothetical protein EI555_012173 [Monodon monoceros]
MDAGSLILKGIPLCRGKALRESFTDNKTTKKKQGKAAADGDSRFQLYRIHISLTMQKAMLTWLLGPKAWLGDPAPVDWQQIIHSSVELRIDKSPLHSDLELSNPRGNLTKV